MSVKRQRDNYLVKSNSDSVPGTTQPVSENSLYEDVSRETEQKLRESEARYRSLAQQLEESEQRYRFMFEQAKVGIAIASLSGQITQANQRYCEIVGYEHEELLHKNFSEITHPDDVVQNRRYLEDLLHNTTSNGPMEKRYIRKDGSIVWANLTLSLMRDVQGNPIDYIAVIQDISAHKTNEIERRQLEQRTREALFQTNNRMEEFLGVASHELRTPLTTIKANIQLSLRRLKNVIQQAEALPIEVTNKITMTQDMLLRAERQIGVLNRLVGDLIDISRIQTGKLQLHLRQEPSDLAQIVQETIQAQCIATPERTIQLEMHTQGIMPVIADPDRITQVLTNYLNNALKYSHPDTPVTTVLDVLESQNEGNEGARQCIARVSVHDQGQGLSPEQQQRIWECFYQVEGVKVLSGSGVGLGLGLYISQTIIQCHHGQVGVESTGRDGSTFWFTLPLAQ
jgi:PAS domain S-box-containing protein